MQVDYSPFQPGHLPQARIGRCQNPYFRHGDALYPFMYAAFVGWLCHIRILPPWLILALLSPMYVGGVQLVLVKGELPEQQHVLLVYTHAEGGPCCPLILLRSCHLLRLSIANRLYPALARRSWHAHAASVLPSYLLVTLRMVNVPAQDKEALHTLSLHFLGRSADSMAAVQYP